MEKLRDVVGVDKVGSQSLAVGDMLSAVAVVLVDGRECWCCRSHQVERRLFGGRRQSVPGWPQLDCEVPIDRWVQEGDVSWRMADLK